METEYMRGQEIKQKYDVSNFLIQRLADKGQIRCIRFGSRQDRRYLREDVEKFFNQGAVMTSADSTAAMTVPV